MGFGSPFEAAQPNGPRPGQTTGRNRNTATNAAAGGTAQPFPLSPGDTAAFGINRQNLWTNYKMTLASLRPQRVFARQQYQMALGQAQQGAAGARSDLAGSMADRGIIGSSVQTAGLQDIAAQRDAAIANAVLAKNQNLYGVAQQGLSANMGLRSGLSELALQRAAAKRQMALGAFGSQGANPWGY